MPAIDTRGPYVKKPKAKKVYGPPKPKRKVYGPPAPKPKPVSGPPTPTVRIKPTYGPPAPKPKKRPVAGPARPKHKQAAGPPKPTRTPRKQTAAEKTNERISERGAKYLNEYLKTRPISDRPENTIANVEKFKTSRKYGEAVVAARTAKEVQDSLKAARKAPDYKTKLGPLTRTTRAKDLIGDTRSALPKKRTAIQDPTLLRTKGKSLVELLAMRDALKPGQDQTKRIDKYIREETQRKGRTKRAGTATGAAGLKVLDYTMRGNYAVAGATSAAAKGKSPAKVAEAAGRGVIGKDKKTFSTVFTEQGWKPKSNLGKAAKGTAAFTADVVTDPSTYAQFGVGSVATKLAKKEAVKAEAKAAKALADATRKGHKLTEKEVARQAERAQGGGAAAPTLAERHGQRAGEKAEKAAPKGKGVVVKFAGKEIPGVRRATAATGRGTQKVARKVIPAGVRAKSGSIRTGLRKTVRPMTRPPEVKAEEWTPTRQAERRSRAHVATEDTRAQTLARELKARIPAEHYEAVIDKLERDQLRKLPAEIRNDKKAFQAVVDVRSAYREAYRKAARAGGVEGKVGDLRTWLSSGDRGALDKTIRGEQKAQKRALTSAQRHARDAAAGLARAEEVARGSMERHAAVATEHARGTERQRAAVETERARGQAAVETERARAQVRREAEVETVRARGQAAVERARAQGKSKAEVEAEQHKANIAVERAKADARVSTAKPDAGLKPLLRDLDKAKTASDTAKTALRRAEGHLKRALAKPKAQRRHIASAYGKLARAQRRAEETGKALALARETVKAERKRTAGVAPAEHQALLDAIEDKATKRTPKPVPGTGRIVGERERALAEHRAQTKAEQAYIAASPTAWHREARTRYAKEARAKREAELGIARVVPERTVAQRVEAIPAQPAKGKRMEKAGAKHGERTETLEQARTRAEAAQAIPSRSLNESDREYLNRLHEHATTHNLPLLLERVEKLQARQPDDLAKGYYPRDFDDRVLKRLGIKPGEVEGHAYARAGIGTKVARVTSGMRRSTQRRLAGVNAAREAAGETPFSTNIPLTTLNYLKEMARTTAKGEFAKELAGQGTAVKVRRDADDKIIQPTVPDGEALYFLGYKGKQYGLHPVNKIAEVRGVKNAPGGQYVTLNPRLVDEMQGETKQIIPSLPGEALYDRASAAWRKTAITSASYHIRNAISDVNTAYLSVKGRKLPGQSRQAIKMVRAGNKQTRQWRPATFNKKTGQWDPVLPSDMTIKVAGKDMRVDEFLKLARKEGVIDSGYFGSEVASLAGEGAERVGRVGRTGGKAGRTLKRANLSRENTMRIAVFKDALDRGLKPAEAADVSNKFLIDYGDLTQFEKRALRRLTGFYTWTARSIPLHAEMLVSRPGKYANVEKLRQNIGNATTGQTEQERQQSMTDAVLKGYPVVVGKRAISLGLSQTLLNEFPTAPTPKAMKAWKDELEKFAWSNLNPIPRAVIEQRTGRNVVTKAEIENEQRPTVAAPAWVQYLPDQLKKSLGVAPPKGKGKGGTGFTDPKTGRAAWGWNGKADWKYDQLMLGFIGQAAAVVNSGRSQATKEQAIGSIVGAKIDPLDKVQKERANVQAGRADLNALKRARGMLNQQGINAEHPTPEWKRLNDAINKAEPKKKKAKKSGGGDKYGFGGGGGSSAGSGNKYGF